jgi:hypothetical protein
VRLDDPEDAEIEFAFPGGPPRKPAAGQDARLGSRVPIPHGIAMVLVAHNLRSPHSGPESPVFATRTERPISRRNVSRALRAAMKRAVRPSGRTTFPALHEDGKQPRGTLPSMHSFRRTLASRALLAGESVDELALLAPARTRGAMVRKGSPVQVRLRAPLIRRGPPVPPARQLVYGSVVEASSLIECAPAGAGGRGAGCDLGGKKGTGAHVRSLAGGRVRRVGRFLGAGSFERDT